MADSLATTVRSSVEWTFTETLDNGNVVDNSKIENRVELADGVAINTADKIWKDRRSLSASASETLDLSALTDTIFGATRTVNLAKVKLIYIFNRSTATGEELLVGGAASDAFESCFGAVAGAKAEVGPNSPLMLANLTDGWTVGTDTDLKIENTGAASIEFDIVILGTSS